MIPILSDEQMSAISITPDELLECEELATIGVSPGDDEAYRGNLSWVISDKRRRKVAKAQLRWFVDEFQTSMDFACNVAKHFDEVRDSRIFFIMQQAFGDTEWEEVQDIINTVIVQGKEFQSLKDKLAELEGK